nr:MAG TPA: hypothetical protein [Caudoviricetes sp.]
MLLRLIAEEQFLSSAKPHNVLQLCVRITTNLITLPING